MYGIYRRWTRRKFVDV